MKLLPALSALLTLASSNPIWPIKSPSPNILKAYESLQTAQQLLLAPSTKSIPPPETVPPPQSPNYRFEAQENSVGVLLTDEKADARHFWLPLGRRVYTRDAPTLPSHPLTARITTLINTSPRLAAPEQLDRIVCEIWTRSSRNTRRGKRIEQRSFSFSKEDGLVRFEDEESPLWLRRQEVESYMCS